MEEIVNVKPPIGEPAIDEKEGHESQQEANTEQQQIAPDPGPEHAESAEKDGPEESGRQSRELKEDAEQANEEPPADVPSPKEDQAPVDIDPNNGKPSEEEPLADVPSPKEDQAPVDIDPNNGKPSEEEPLADVASPKEDQAPVDIDPNNGKPSEEELLADVPSPKEDQVSVDIDPNNGWPPVEEPYVDVTSPKEDQVSVDIDPNNGWPPVEEPYVDVTSPKPLRAIVDVDPNSVKCIIEVTGLSTEEAKKLLAEHSGNMARAIDYHLDGWMARQAQNADSVVASSAAPAATSFAAVAEDNIRSPIPAQFDQLVTPESDNFRMWRRRVPSQTVVPLRNFAREAAIQEEALNRLYDKTSNGSGGDSGGGGDGLDNETNVPVNDGAAVVVSSARAGGSGILKRSRLEDLFRPPVELISPGTVYEVREHATRQNRWLLINLQNNVDFQSQVLNRDVWSDASLRELIKRHFIFWQSSIDSLEGSKFQCFYHVKTTPYIGLLDPRTGEEKKVLNVSTPVALKSDLESFLKENGTRLDGSDDADKEKPSAESTSVRFTHDLSTTTEARKLTTTTTTKSAAELSEEQQMELAIKNSLAEIVVHNSDSEEEDEQEAEGGEDDYAKNRSRRPIKRRRLDKEVIILSSDTEEFDLDGNENSDDYISDIADTAADNRDQYKVWLGKDEDEKTQLQLRLPDGNSMQLNWPCTSQLRALKVFVEAKFPEHTDEPYKILTTCPRRNLLSLDLIMTLKDAGLHPRSVLYLHTED